jgi:hypothetical protein
MINSAVRRLEHLSVALNTSAETAVQSHQPDQTRLGTTDNSSGVGKKKSTQA